MSLRFYIGASGAGKSTALYQEIIRRSQEEPQRSFLVIVPDQFTMQTQMDMVCMHPRKGIMNIDVLSFGRLSHRIFEEVGQETLPVLDDTGKSLVLRKIAGKLAGKTTVIGGNLNKTGYIHEVKSAISEFMQYGIGVEELDRLTEYARKKGSLYYKLKDLGVLYRGFREFIAQKAITTEETLELLAEKLPESGLIRGSVVAIDGFTGFTPVQNQVIRQLLELADEVIVSVVMDGREDMYADEGEQDLFHLSRKTVASLTRLAAEAGTARGEDVILSQRPVYRYRHNPSLAWLEQHLFRYPLRPYCPEDKQQPLSIRILEASTQREEVRQVMIAIREYLRQTGGCYRDVAIIAGDLSAYASQLETQAQLYGIPLYLDRTRGIVLNPFIEYVKSAILIIAQNFSYETVFHYIRSGLADFEPEEADELENYVLAMGIRGKKKWTTPFFAPPPDCGDRTGVLEALNKSREKLLEQLLPLMGRFGNTRELVLGLYTFIEQNNVQKKLKEYEDAFEKAQDTVRAREYAQIYRLVMDLLDQIVELIGDEPVKMEEFYRILEAGFGEIQVGTIPRSVDRVLAGDMERTRLKQVKALFFLGVNDGYIPKAAQNGGIISDMDREFLAQSKTELAPTPRQQMYIQRLYLYMNMTKPSDLLVLSFSRMSGEGTAMRPAYLIGQIRKLFPSLETECPQERPRIDQVQSLEDGRHWLVQELRRFADGGMEEDSEEERDFASLLSLWSGREETAGWTRRMVQSAFYEYREQPLDRAAALALFGSTLLGSVSRLEQYASCAYAHFLQYGLKLKERDGFDFEAVDLGNVFHGVLELFGEKLRERGYSWFDFPKEEGEALVEEAVETYAASYRDTVLYDTARSRYMIVRLKRILKRTVSTLQYQLRKGVFQPSRFEVSFSALEDLESVNIALTDREKLHLRGRIDRVDTWEDDSDGEDRIYVKVIDYKSGSRDFSLAALYYGLQLQLVVYMNAAMEMEKRNRPDARVLPAAMLYYRVQDPLVQVQEKTQEMTAEQINAEILTKLRMTGVVNASDRVVRGLDGQFDTRSDVIPVERTKDGSFGARSSLMEEADFQVISDYVNLKIRELGTDILNGRIPLNPVGQAGSAAQASACTYCPYSRVCGFDKKMPGYSERQLEKLSEEEALEKMREKTEENGGDIYTGTAGDN